ncbi:MAG: Ig-like domain-containing protein, partial [Spirochaetes bacterium]|nr:Ig-like domain-containing protein [Spirochaetota bacterium]
MKNIIITGVIVFLLFLVMACSREVPDMNVLDQSSPTIISTSPATGSSGISKFTKVIINFSETIDPNSFSPAMISIIPPIPYSYTANGNQVVITPTGDMPDGQKFWVTLSGQISDMAGNIMGSGYTFFFRTEGHNNALGKVTFLADNSVGKNYYMVYICGSWDGFGDWDSAWNNGVRYPMYDDGQHNDGVAGDGVWGYIQDLSVDTYHEYRFGIDDDNDANNGYVKDRSFFILTSAPKSETVYLYPPVPVTFNY